MIQPTLLDEAHARAVGIHPPRHMIHMTGMLRTADHEPPDPHPLVSRRRQLAEEAHARAVGTHSAPTFAKPPVSYMHGTERCIHCHALIGRTSLRFPWFHVGSGDEQCHPSTNHQEMNQ